MQSRTGATIRRGFLFVAALAAMAGSARPLAAQQAEGVGFVERLLAAENTLSFEAVETTIDSLSTGEKMRVTSRILVSEGRRLEKIIETNVPAEVEGSRGSRFANGPADVETLPVPMFPDGINNLVRLGQNYAFTRLGPDDDAGFRIEPRHHGGYPIEVVVDRSGIWRKISVFDGANHPRVIRSRDSIKVLGSLEEERLAELRKKGRPAVAQSGGSHVDEAITVHEARHRLPGFVVPRGALLGFQADRIESVTDGATGKEAIFTTLRDGLCTLVLVQMRAVHADVEVQPGDAGNEFESGDRVIVNKSVDRSDSGVAVYKWTNPNGIDMLLVSTLPAADTRRVIEEIVRPTTPR